MTTETYDPLDLNTLALVGFQAEKRRRWLSAPVPDRAEAALCLQRIDEIFDRRPRIIAWDNGQPIYSDADPWVLNQIGYVPPETPLEPEPASPELLGGGGVAVMDRPPDDAAEVLSTEDEKKMRKWRRMLDGM